MKTIDPNTTLGALVTGHPELARELERRSLDYCCGGDRSLAAACTEQGLDANSVAAELSAVAVDGMAAEWSTMGAAELVAHVVETHHRYLWGELPRLSALIAKIVAVHGERHPELLEVASCFEAIRADLEPHLLKEERVLFPMIGELAAATSALEFHCGTLRNPISVMLSEHDALGDLLARLRRLTDDYRTPADGCASYLACFTGLAELEADTHLHIHKENNLLFPLVVKLESDLTSV